MEYTKGEWKIERSPNSKKFPFKLYKNTGTESKLIAGVNSLANANLIASAPNLYEACLSALGAMLTLDNNKEWVKEIAGVVKKALAKAEGKDG